MKKRNYYKHKHTFDTTSKVGIIQPSFIRPVTPLDTWGGVQTSIGRMAPMNKPVFGNFYYDQFMFYVKNSDIWNKSTGMSDEWRDAITGAAVTWPSSTGYVTGAGEDKIMHGGFGVGGKVAATTPPAYSKLPRMAYNHVYNKFFRHKDNPEIVLDTGADLLPARYKSRGYFNLVQQDVEEGSTVTIDTSGSTLDIATVKDKMREENYAKLKERYGNEYEDLLRMHGVKVSNHEGPMLVAKNSTNVGISEVLTTADSDLRDTGDYVGHGIVYGKMNVAKRLYLEHGWLIGVTVLRPRFVLKNRVDRMFMLNDAEDWYHKFYVGNKMRDVQAIELYSKVNAGHDDVWGYAEHYDYLRSSNDIVAGAYIDGSTYDDQILGIEAGTGAGPTAWSSLENPLPTDYDHLFQDSSQPAIYIHNRNNIGVNSQLPRRGL